MEIHIESMTVESLQDLLEKANIVAAFLVGHRRILTEGGFPQDTAERMCEVVHFRLLGIDESAGMFASDEDFALLEFLGEEEEE